MKPSLPYFRKSSKPDSRNSSPKSIKSPRYGTSEFFASLESQIRRLDPEFFFIWGEESPLTQAFNCVKQAIDQILNKSSSTEALSSLKQRDSINSATKVFSTEDHALLINFKEKEENLRQSIEKIQKQEEKNLIEKEKLRKMKKTLFELEDELRTVKEELNNEFILLNQQKAKFRMEKEAFEKEKMQVRVDKKMILEEKLAIDQRIMEFNAAYDDLEVKKEILLQEKSGVDRNRWLFEQEKEQFGQNLAGVMQSKELLQIEFARIEKERNELIKLKQEVSMLPKDSKPLIEFYDDSKSPSFAYRELSSHELGNAELENIMNKINENLQQAQQDLINKSEALDEREKLIISNEKKIAKQAAELALIKESLVKSSNELNELSQVSMPKLTTDSKIIDKLLNQLEDLQKQLLHKTQSSNPDLQLIEQIKSFNNDEQVLNLLNLLEEKIEQVNYKEKIILESIIEFDSRERNLELAEERVRDEQRLLKEEHETRMDEIETARAEMHQLQSKLEAHLNKIEDKEKQLVKTFDEIRKVN